VKRASQGERGSGAATGGHGRAERLQEALREELVGLIRREVKDPRLEAAGLLTVAAVRLSPDLGTARVYVSFVGGEAGGDALGLAALARAAGFLAGAAARALRMRRSPSLRFILDDTEDRAAHIEALLRESGGSESGS
jgi:ribosome-binding factor A